MSQNEIILQKEPMQNVNRPLFRELLGQELSQEERHILLENAEARIAATTVKSPTRQTDNPTASEVKLEQKESAPDKAARLVEKVKSGTSEELENYCATKYIGEGGLFYVLKGHNNQLDNSRPVALKIPKQQKHLAALKRHKDTLLRLNHQNITDIIDANLESEIPFVAEQLIDDETLADIIAKNKSSGKYLSEETVLNIANQLLSAIAHMHERGVTHKDIKPHNILMKDGKVYVTDFNIADIVEDDVTQAKNTLVTASSTRFEAFTDIYASPEQRYGKDIDSRTDLYSLSLLLFELLTNQVPIGNDVDPSAFNPNLSHNFIPFFTKALKSRPEDRYQNAEEMSEALKSTEAKSMYGKGKVVYHTINEVYIVSFGSNDKPSSEEFFKSKNGTICCIAVSPDKQKIAILEHINTTSKNHRLIVKKLDGKEIQLFNYKDFEYATKLIWNQSGINIYDDLRANGSWLRWNMDEKILEFTKIPTIAEKAFSPNGKYYLHYQNTHLYAVDTDNMDMQPITEKNHAWLDVTGYLWISEEPAAKPEQKSTAQQPCAKQEEPKKWYKPWTWK